MNILTKIGSLDNVVTYEHYCDAKSDLTNIPKNQITLGSTAIVLKDEDDTMGIYIADSHKEWIAVSTSMSGGGSGGGTVSADIIHICSQNEYDASTGLPTVEEPEENVFYLVPSGDDESSNLFDEWVYVNEAWEQFGSGVVGPAGEDYVLTEEDKDDIAAIVLANISTATGVSF